MVGMAEAIYVWLNLPSRQGVGLLFTLPLTWAFCAFIFQDIVGYCAGGFGLKIFYATTVIRYLLLPVLTCISGDVSSPYGIFAAEAYRYAIIIQDIELVVCCITIRLFYQKTLNKCLISPKGSPAFYDDISLSGLIFIALSVSLIYLRGAERLLKTMRFGIVSDILEEDAMYGYDIWLAHTLMAVIVIIVVGKFQKANDKKESFMNLLIPIVCVGLSCLFIFGNNRMMIIYFAVSGIATLQFAFPKKTKLFMMTIVPTMAIVLISFTMVKQFRMDLRSDADIDAERTADILAAYVTGTESIAKTVYMYEKNGDKVQLLTPLADIVNKTTLFQLPGMNAIIKKFYNIPTTYGLATIGSEIMPIAGQTLFLGGYTFGWLLDIIAYAVIMRLLVYFECKMKTVQRSGDVYIYTWVSVIFAMAMCYSMAVIYNGLTYVPLFSSCFLLVIRNTRFLRTRRMILYET